MTQVKIVPVGLLKRYLPDSDVAGLESPPGRSVSDMLATLGIPSAIVGAVLVNGRQVAKSYVLQAGDEVKLIPLMGGG